VTRMVPKGPAWSGRRMAMVLRMAKVASMGPEEEGREQHVAAPARARS
jgi:hypothetical protein